MARQFQIYFKTVATCTVNDTVTDAQIASFLQNIYATSQAQTRFQSWRDSFKTAVRFVIGRPAAVSAGAQVVSWHFHLETGGTIDEPEA